MISLEKSTLNIKGMSVMPVNESFDPISAWIKEKVTVRIVIVGKTRKNVERKDIAPKCGAHP